MNTIAYEDDEASSTPRIFDFLAEKYLSISFLGEGGDHNTWAGLTLVFDNVRTLSCFILCPDTEKIAARPREAGVVVVSVFKMVFRDCFFSPWRWDSPATLVIHLASNDHRGNCPPFPSSSQDPNDCSRLYRMDAKKRVLISDYPCWSPKFAAICHKPLTCGEFPPKKTKCSLAIATILLILLSIIEKAKMFIDFL